MFWKKFEKIFVILLLGIFLSLNLSLAATDSQTIDEGPHISAGYSYLRTGDFRMNPEHPPLVKILSALPLLFVNPDLPLEHESWGHYNQWEFGRQFLYRNRVAADTIIFLARLGPIILGLILGFFIYRWARELFGLKAGIFALFLYSFSPNFIGHAHLVTTDVALALFLLLSIYYFGRYLKEPNKKNLLIAGLMFALGFNAKYSAILVILILIFIYWFHRWIRGKETCLGLKKFLIIFLVFTALTGLVTFAFYGFEIKRPLAEPRVVRLYEEREEIEKEGTAHFLPVYLRPLISWGDPATKTGRFLKSFAENFPLPAYTYWRGFFSVLLHNHWGHGAFLMGQTSYHGWWYYFIVAFLVKTPLSTLLLALLLFIYSLYKLAETANRKNIKICRLLKNLKFDYWLLFLPALLYFALSLTSRINLGVRHILPVYPFIFIGLASLVNIKIGSRSKKILFNIFLILIMAYYLFTSFMIFPHSLSYFNEVIGGAKNGHLYLLDSNLDWSQDAKRLVNYLEKENIKKIRVIILGSLDLNYYFPNNLGFPTNEEVEKNGLAPGYYAISASVLHDPNGRYNWPARHEPIDRIGYSIYLFKF